MELVDHTGELDTLDHVAIQVACINSTVTWYTSRFNCSVEYQDETWAMLNFRNTRLALVVKDQHPPHIGIGRSDAIKYGPLKRHRDGTESCYLKDPDKNLVEVVQADREHSSLAKNNADYHI